MVWGLAKDTNIQIPNLGTLIWKTGWGQGIISKSSVSLFFNHVLETE